MASGSTGKDAEAHACRHMQMQGLKLLQRNYRTRRGEIDLVMQDKDSLVFVEVRYRNREDYGSAAESIDRRKQRKLTACAQQYLQAYPERARQPCRFDVVTISREMERIEWIRNAFDTLEQT